ncbi:MAG TPA: hypothetical protein DDW52_16420 [Planctomycetaceae bacterium]|nr:hypothetical protein [Planctomycetaceae bacterium]
MKSEAANDMQPYAAAPTFVQYFVHFIVACLLAAQMAPAVNESHYIPKARHVWDSTFAPHDFFLQSHDSHYLASWSAGLPATLLGFVTTTWLGRFASWLLMAIAWVHLMRAVRMPALLSPFVFAFWHVAVTLGHWSGEWALGGFEAKSIAYPFVFLGLSAVVRDHWQKAWIYLAIAVAWHPLAGGWAGMSVGIYWLFLPELRRRMAEQWLAFVVAIAIGLIGVLPAAMGLAGENLDGKVVASQVHVYFRLPHHLCPQAFIPLRHWSATVTLLVFIAAAGWYGLASRTGRAQADVARDRSSSPERLGAIAAIAITFAVIGLAIDLLMSERMPSTASNLLRFYWFRWADISVPLAGSVLLWLAAAGFPDSPDCSGINVIRARPLHLVPLVLAATMGATYVVAVVNASTIPVADKLVVETTGPISKKTDRYQDWLAVCAWIRENTPEDSLWLTPKYQQSFKWHAQRAEVVCWKDVPQDNQSVHQWFERITACEPPRDSRGVVRGWTEAEIVRLADKYDFEWILVDRTIQDKPILEVAYPSNDGLKYIANSSFAVLRLRPSIRAALTAKLIKGNDE